MTDLRPGLERPVLLAVGGGKGGVGKSVLSILIGQWLALLGRRVVIVDLDLSGANLHTLLGIRDIRCTLGDLLSRRVNSLAEIAVRTSTPNLRAVCGSSDDLALANPCFAQKIKIMQKLLTLDAEYVVMDLGAGTSFNVLDFFLVADLQVVVTTAEPIAVYNAYGFLRNAVYRRVSQLTRGNPMLHEVVRRGMDPHNREELHTLGDLMRTIELLADRPAVRQLERALERVRPSVVVNRVREERDGNASGVIREVAGKYLRLKVSELGTVPHDRLLASMVARMQALTDLREGGSFESSYHVATALVEQDLARRAGARLSPAPGRYSASAG